MGAGPLPQPAEREALTGTTGVIAALPAEARCLAGRSLRPGGIHGDRSILIGLAGMGPERAAAMAGRLLQHAAALVSWGTAGGLAPQARPGDLVLPETVVSPTGDSYPVDASWRERAVAALHGRFAVLGGRIAGSPHLVESATDKASLHSATGAVAVDMESAAIAAAASAAGAPFLAVRAIADPASLSQPRYIHAITDEFGRVRAGRLLAAVAGDPRSLGALLALGLAFGAALKTLRRVAACQDRVLTL